MDFYKYYIYKFKKVTASVLNQQTINNSGQSHKSPSFSGIDRIDAYFHESNGAAAWNNDRYLGKAYSINSSTLVSFSFANSDARPNSAFFALPDHSIPFKPISYIALKKIDIRKAFE